MATHTQLKLWFAAHLAGEPKTAPCQLHPQWDSDSHAAEAAVRCAPSRGAKSSTTHKGDSDSHTAEAAVRCAPSRGAKSSTTHKGDSDSHAAEAAVRCLPGREAKEVAANYKAEVPWEICSEPKASPARGGGTAEP